jgi:hypothetical protein
VATNTLVYSPSIEIHIETVDGETIDVSDDVTQSNLTLRTDPGFSSLDFSLQNAVRKYDGMFTPMDKVVVYMTRVKRLLVFSGYLDKVPVFTAFPGIVSISASSTMKRLVNFLWDVNTTESRQLLKGDPNQAKNLDGGVSLMVQKILTDVVGWPLSAIHIGNVPAQWFDYIGGLADRLVAEAQAAEVTSAIGAGIIAGAGVAVGITPTGTVSDSDIKALMKGAGFPESEFNTGVGVAHAESGARPGVKSPPNFNGTFDYGLWQINSVHTDLLSGHDWSDPTQNTAMAYAIWRDAGGSWTPWYTFRDGKHLPFLAAAAAAPVGSGTPVVSTVSAIPATAASAAKANNPGGNGVPAPSPNEYPYISMSKQFLAAFPGGVVTSDFRAGDPSHHGVGQAIDMVPGSSGKSLQDIANWVFQAYPLSAQLIYINGPFMYHEVGNPRANGAIDVDNANQDQIKQIYRDDYMNHCVPLDVPILTRRGWLNHADVVVGDETPGYNFDTQQNEWTRITHINRFDSAEVVERSSNRWKIRSTRNHRWVARSSATKKYSWTTTDAPGQLTWRVAAPLADDQQSVDITTDEAELLGWLLTDGSQWASTTLCSFDGCINYARAKGHCGTHRRQWLSGQSLKSIKSRGGSTPDFSMFAWQTKPEGVARLAEILGSRARYNGKGYRLDNVYAMDLLNRTGLTSVKNGEELLALLPRLSSAQREAMLAGVVGGDGTNNGRTILQDEGPMLTVISTLAYYCGHRVYVRKRDVGTSGYPNSNGVHMAASLALPFVSTYRQGSKSLGYMPVWCPTTELGTWTAQFDGNPVLTGNSNHVHWASQTPLGIPGSVGPSGLPTTGTTSSTPSGSGMGLTSDQVGAAIFNVFLWQNSPDGAAIELTNALGGIRALMNDEPVLDSIKIIMRAGLRSFGTAPNGDFIGWFPDYFGQWGTAAKMIIEDIELQEGFSIAWSDEYLKTHFFVTPSVNGGGVAASTQEVRLTQTAGIASVEYPELMKALFRNPIPKFNFDNGALKFLSRYGARIANDSMDNLNVLEGAFSHRIEFFFAVQNFMKNWSEQFAAQVSMTFMPEVYPGMLLVFPSYGVQAYVTEVSHTFDSTSGYETSPSCIAWSNIGDGGVPGLPNGGRV